MSVIEKHSKKDLKLTSYLIYAVVVLFCVAIAKVVFYANGVHCVGLEEPTNFMVFHKELFVSGRSSITLLG